MKTIFNPDSWVMKALAFLADVMLLNVFFLIGCIPVITIGASMSAMYSVAMKMVQKRENGIMKPFFKAWKGSFKNGLIFELMFAVMLVLIWCGLEVVNANSENLSWLFSAGYLLATFVLMTVMSWTWPLEAAFVNTVGTTLRNAFLLGFAHLGKSFAVVIINLIPIVLLMFAPDYFLATGIVWFLGGFAAIAVVNSLVFSKVLKKYIDGEEETPDGSEQTEEEVPELTGETPQLTAGAAPEPEETASEKKTDTENK